MFFAISNYVYVMIASVDLSLKQIIRNALALYLIKPFGTLITMIVQAVIIFVAIGLLSSRIVSANSIWFLNNELYSVI